MSASSTAAVSLLAAVSVLLRPSSSMAERKPLAVNLWVDVPVLAAGTVGWATTETVLKPALAPATCRWCVPDALDWAVRSALVWRSPGTADTISNVSAYAVVPALAAGGLALAAWQGGAPEQIPGDLLVVAESAVLSMDLDQVVKFTVARERPFVHALPAAAKRLTAAPDDNNVSFYSAHASWTFALAASAGTVASLHGDALAPVIWGVGMTLATGTAYLRIAADKHYLTDVLSGAVMGSAFGVGVPYLLHRPATLPVTAAWVPIEGGGLGSVTLRF